MIHTPKKSRGKLKPQMVKVPKYRKNSDRKQRELSNVEKGMIIAFFVIYGTISTVSLLVGRLWSTVNSFLQWYYKYSTTDNLLRSGWPEVLSKHDKQTILRTVRKYRQYTCEQIHRIYAPHISLPTFDCLLRQHNIKKWLAKKRPRVKMERVKAQLQWAITRKDWTAEDFQRVIYSDECSVEQQPA